MLAGGNLPFGLLENSKQSARKNHKYGQKTRHQETTRCVYLRIHEYDFSFLYPISFRYPVSHSQILHQER